MHQYAQLFSGKNIEFSEYSVIIISHKSISDDMITSSLREEEERRPLIELPRSTDLLRMM